MVELRNGQTVEDQRLDRLTSFDARSRNFPITAVSPGLKPRSFTWKIDTDYVIDQGREGACVGFAITNELQTTPAPSRFQNDEQSSHEAATQFALSVYREAQTIDEWPGEGYSGTSVLAGMKVAQRLGYFDEYRWAFGVDDLIYGLGRNGPAVLGIPWYESMYQPEDGWVRVRGAVAGGHAILARGIKLVKATDGGQAIDLAKSYVLLRNSWGPDWGSRGDAKISLLDVTRLLGEQGEAVFAVGRHTVANPRPPRQARIQPRSSTFAFDEQLGGTFAEDRDRRGEDHRRPDQA